MYILSNMSEGCTRLQETTCNVFIMAWQLLLYYVVMDVYSVACVCHIPGKGLVANNRCGLQFYVCIIM